MYRAPDDLDSTARTVPYAHDKRVDGLEVEVKEVRAEVVEINNKLDLLVNAVYREPIPVHHSTPPPPTRPAHTAGPYSRHDGAQPLLIPRPLRREANQNGYVDAIAHHNHFVPPQIQGKQASYDPKNLVRKPYMYIERGDCQTDKQRLEVRCSLTTLEYI